MRKADIQIQRLTEKHGAGVIDIINYYVENTEYTLVNSKIPYELFDKLKAKEGNVLSLVALEDEKVLGTAMFKNGGSFALGEKNVEMSIYIDRSHIRNGIGRELFAEAKKRLAKLGKDAVFSRVKAENSASIEFHKAMDFERIKKEKDILYYKYAF